MMCDANLAQFQQQSCEEIEIEGILLESCVKSFAINTNKLKNQPIQNRAMCVHEMQQEERGER